PAPENDIPLPIVVFDVLTIGAGRAPGTSCTKPVKFRLSIGRFCTSLSCSVEDTSDLVVSTTGAVPDTVSVSASAARRSEKSTVLAVPTTTVTPFLDCGANPLIS